MKKQKTSYPNRNKLAVGIIFLTFPFLMILQSSNTIKETISKNFFYIYVFIAILSAFLYAKSKHLKIVATVAAIIIAFIFFTSISSSSQINETGRGVAFLLMFPLFILFSLMLVLFGIKSIREKQSLNLSGIKGMRIIQGFHAEMNGSLVLLLGIFLLIIIANVLFIFITGNTLSDWLYLHQAL